MTKICKKCGVEKKPKDFYVDSSGKLQSACKKCQIEYQMERYHKRHEMVRKIKERLKCIKCGERRHYMLEFHHLDPLVKENNISQMLSGKEERLLDEMKKCVVMCSNCHKELHHLDVFLQEYLAMDY